MKTKNECIEYLQKRITNNQNMIEVSYFNSIIEHLKSNNRIEMIKQGYDEYTKRQVEKDITEDELEALSEGIDDDYIVSTEEKNRLLGNIKCQ